MTPAAIGALAHTLGARLVETHVSWVLLGADTAWKIKKPVTLPFVDYGTLAAREHFCAEEVRLNQRLAPGLYLGVSRITGTPERPVLDGDGPVLDHAVRMRRFPDGMLFSELLAAGTLAPGEVDALADLVARFHADAAIAGPDDGFATPRRRSDTARAAFDGATAALAGEQAPHDPLARWLRAQAEALAPLWTRRLADGRVRECHGDLHLANVVRLDGAVAAFDAIEFDPGLRWIDVLDDIAFPVMDFCAQGNRGFAFRLLDAWLDRTGDHGTLPALRHSVAYRALVRATAQGLRGETVAARRYVDTARAWTRAGTPRLLVMHGLPGSGKTFRSQQLLEALGAIRLRSDVERKRQAGLGMLADSRAAGLALYDADTSRKTYARLFDLARAALASGYPVVLDAAFLLRAERDAARAVADGLRVPFAIVDCQAPMAVLRERLLARWGDASEADATVLDRLATAVEPLQPDEPRWLPA